MDSVKNPFSPGAGSPPPELAGRDKLTEQADILLERIKHRRSEQSMILTGLRGVGKTVLLNEIERMAIGKGYPTISIEAYEGKPLGLLIAPHLRQLLFDLDRVAGTSDKVKRGLRVLRSFIGTVRLSFPNTPIELDIDPERGTADSGNLEVDLPALLVAVAEAAEDRGCAVALFIDEIQYLNRKELGALIMALHRIQQRQLPLAMVSAGLPVLPGLAGESKSYAERLLSFPIVGALSEADSARAIEEPARAAGVSVDPAALKEVFRLTKGYPYFLQEWGYQIWKIANTSPITRKVVDAAGRVAITRLDENFFRVRFDRLTPSEKNFLRAMAEIGPGPARTGDIADKLETGINKIGVVRANLIRKGMIYSPAHGDLAFTVPLFDEFMKRSGNSGAAARNHP